MQPAGIDKPMRLVAEDRLEARLAAQHRERHAVHVARRRGQRRIEVRMGVEPQDEQFAPRLGRMAGDAADRPHRQAVIAAEHDRRPPGAHDRVSLARQQPRPGRDLGEPLALPSGAGARMGAGGSEIAPVLDVVPEIPERFHDARGAQHGRAHRRAGHARAGFDRRAEDGDRLPGRLSRLPIPVGLAARLPAQDRPLRHEPEGAIRRAGAAERGILRQTKRNAAAPWEDPLRGVPAQGGPARPDTT